MANMLSNDTDLVQIKERIESDYSLAQSEFDRNCQLIDRHTTDPDTNQAIQQRVTDSEKLLNYLGKLDDLQQEVTKINWGAIEVPSIVANCKFISIQGDFTWSRKTCPALSCRYMEFFGDAIFEGAQFAGKVIFTGTRFTKKVDFSEAIFKDMDFSSCVFNGETSFNATRVIGKARFNLAQFHGPAYFVLMTFESDAYFPDCRFQDLNFQGARFNRNAWFMDVTFSGMVKFSRAKFYGGAVFSVTGSNEERGKVQSIFDCDEAVFLSRADFTNREFCGRTDFSHAVFETAPIFHGAKLHQASNFSETKFLASGGICSGWRRWWSFANRWWRQSPRQLEDVKRRFRWMNYFAMADRNAYRTLKLHMGAMRAQEEDGMFFALEQRAARQAASFWNSPLEKSLSWGYDLISSYGQGAGRAFLCLLIWNGVFYVGYTYLTGSPDALLNPACTADCKGSFLASNPPLGLALQAAINPLALVGDRTLFLIPAALPWVFASAALQTVGSLSIFTLLLLAIRRRFHKGSE